ncbi:uncharacterized protein DS421_12g374330 [Arachis hypogaea]|nr:uncharacterized protein DS421_12g374330 [Arachis hypogaea]
MSCSTISFNNIKKNARLFTDLFCSMARFILLAYSWSHACLFIDLLCGTPSISDF